MHRRTYAWLGSTVERHPRHDKKHGPRPGGHAVTTDTSRHITHGHMLIIYITPQSQRVRMQTHTNDTRDLRRVAPPSTIHPVPLLAPSIVQLLTPAPSVDLDLSAFSLHHSSRSLSISLSLLRSSLIVPRATVCTSQRRIGIENSTSERERRRRSAKRPAAVILRPAPGPCRTIGLSE